MKYPRSRIRGIVKERQNVPLAKSVDVLIYLNYQLFIQKLIQDAAVKAGGEKFIRPHHIRQVQTDTLKKFRG